LSDVDAARADFAFAATAPDVELLGRALDAAPDTTVVDLDGVTFDWSDVRVVISSAGTVVLVVWAPVRNVPRSATCRDLSVRSDRFDRPAEPVTKTSRLLRLPDGNNGAAVDPSS
jgi:hypothetical protein